MGKYCQLTILFLCSILQAFSQVPNFSKVVHYEPTDSANIAYLVNHGVQVKKKEVIVWFPKDSLSFYEMNKIADTISRGVIAAEKFIKAPTNWQAHKKGDPYTLYFRLDSFLAHGSFSGFVSIPFYKIRDGNPPWLHEIMHEMLNPKSGNWLDEKTNTEKEWAENMPLWMAEGLPEYISMEVSQQNNFPFYHTRTNMMYGNIDSICRENLKTEKAAYILSFIGRKGNMPELFGPDRRTYAPAFYNCSCSFVKYLVGQKGLEPLLQSFSSYPNEQQTLEKLITPFLNFKKAWVKQLQLNQ